MFRVVVLLKTGENRIGNFETREQAEEFMLTFDNVKYARLKNKETGEEEPIWK